MPSYLPTQLQPRLPKDEPFRAHVLCPNGLEQIQVVPLASRLVLPRDLPPESCRAGFLRGRSEFRAFMRALGIDSIVQTVGNEDNLTRTFQVVSPDQILASIEAELRAPGEETRRILEGFPPRPRSRRYREDFVLGATTLGSAEGAWRMSEWLTTVRRLNP